MKAFLRALVFVVCASVLAPTARVQATTTISVTDANFSRSPNNWDVGVSEIRSICAAAFINPSFTGTSLALNVNTSGLTGFLTIVYSIDGGAFTTQQIVGGNTTIYLATDLADATHSFIAYINACGATTTFWTAQDPSLAITGVTLDTGKTLIATPVQPFGYLMTLGDSTMANYGANADVALSVTLGRMLSRTVGGCAFSGQQWTSTSSENVPGLASAWKLNYAGSSRVFTPTPGIIINNMGYNGTVTAAAVVSWLEDVRATLPLVYINQVLPFNQAGVPTNCANITQGVADYLTAHPSDTRVKLIDLGASGQAIISNPLYSADGVHPNGAGCIALGALIVAQIIPVASPGNPFGAAIMVFYVPSPDWKKVARREETNPLAA